MAEDANTLRERIREDLLASGFPTELAVGGRLRSRGWLCQHAQYYIDLDEKKGREIDILAWKGSHESRHGPDEPEASADASVTLVVECKKSHRPWVALMGESPLLERTGICHRPHGSDFLFHPRRKEARRVMAEATRRWNWHWGRKGAVSLYEAARLSSSREGPARTAERNAAFEALLAVSKATRHVAQRNADAASRARHMNFFLPVIVLDGPLFEASWAGDDMQVAPADHVGVLSTYLSPSYMNNRGFLVDVVTRDAFERYLSEHVDPLVEAVEQVPRALVESGAANLPPLPSPPPRPWHRRVLSALRR